MISLLLPTRKRPNNVKRLVDSLINTTSNINDIELYFYIDDDDNVSLELISKISNTINTKAIQGTYMSEHRTPTWYMQNELVKACTGPIFFYGADDVVFRTKNWDVVINKLYNNYEDKILLAYAPDGFQGGAIPVATHGFLHKNWVDIIGYLFPPVFNVAYNDTWITEVSETIKRRTYITDMYIEHMHPAANKANWDDVYLTKRETNGNEASIWHQLAPKRIEDANKLQQFINIFK
jgi:hypothetical protein